MLPLLVALVCGAAGGALAAPVPTYSSSVLPDYFVLESFPQDPDTSQRPSVAALETEVQLRRQEAIRNRLHNVRTGILRMLKLPCVPRGPPDSAPFSDPKVVPMLDNLLQNKTDSDGEDLLKRAQSFYPTCELPEDVSSLFRQHRNSMKMFFNLSSFFVSQPENVTTEMAELRLHRVARRKDRRHEFGFNYGLHFNEMESDRMRVSVYASHATVPDDERLVDSFLVPRYSEEVVTLNVNDAFWGADDLNLLLRVTVEDVFGRSLSAADFFEQMDCSVVNPGPQPRPFLRYLNQYNVSLPGPRNPYPVLDLSTAESADWTVADDFVPSIERCPEPAPLLDSQPRFYNRPNGYGDRLQMLHRRRRHHRRPHNRRHAGRHGQLYRGQH